MTAKLCSICLETLTNLKRLSVLPKEPTQSANTEATGTIEGTSLEKI